MWGLKMNDMELSVVVPVYQEAQNILPFIERTCAVLKTLTKQYEIIFCLDPSSDNTEEEILEAIQHNVHLKLIVFSRRFGQPAATLAGIFACKGKYCVVIDVDLQDPPELIRDLYQQIQQGYDVVYAKRRTREGENWLKKTIAYVGYALIEYLSDVKIPRNTGDFRMINRRIIDTIKEYHGTEGYLRGLVAYAGFKQTYVLYDRESRWQGQGHYNRFTGSIQIGLNGIVGFSYKPLQMIWMGGLGLCILSIFLGIFFTAMVGVIAFFSGLQLFCLGLVGEYVGRIYNEVKGRPLFIIDKKVNFDNE